MVQFDVSPFKRIQQHKLEMKKLKHYDEIHQALEKLIQKFSAKEARRDSILRGEPNSKL